MTIVIYYANEADSLGKLHIVKHSIFKSILPGGWGGGGEVCTLRMQRSHITYLAGKFTAEIKFLSHPLHSVKTVALNGFSIGLFSSIY